MFVNQNVIFVEQTDEDTIIRKKTFNIKKYVGWISVVFVELFSWILDVILEYFASPAAPRYIKTIMPNSVAEYKNEIP